jgi:uncharacterized protein
MDAQTRPLAVVTGASSGIGFELAVQCARHGFDLVVAADRPLDDVVSTAAAYRARVQPVLTDLATMAGVDELLAVVGDRTVDALLANAGQGRGHAFLDQTFDAVRSVVDTNVTGTLYLLHAIGRRMRERGTGRILITGSIAGYMPGTFHAVYNGSKAFIDSFTAALRNELQDSGVTVTCLMPGATDTAFFERAGLQGTKLDAQRKDDPAMVARLGFDAMMAGQGAVVTGLFNRLQLAAAKLMPATALAAAHRKLAEPGSPSRQARKDDEAGHPARGETRSSTTDGKAATAARTAATRAPAPQAGGAGRKRAAKTPRPRATTSSRSRASADLDRS